MAKHTSIEVIKNLFVSTSGIQFNSKNSTLTNIPGIRFNELSGYWEYNNGNEQWLPIGAGKTDVFYVNQFPTEPPIEIGIYITEEGESKYYTGENWISLSLEAVTDLTQHTTDNKVIPTCKAVADYVIDTIEDSTKDFITSSVTDLTNFYNKTDIDNKKYITSSISELENFYNKSEIDNKGYITSSVIDLTNFYNKSYINTNYYTNNEVSSLINQKIAGAFKFCGVCTKAKLSTKEKIVGNVWQISGLDDDGSTGAEYACNKELEWIKLGYTIDLSNYYTKSDIDNKNYITSSVSELENFYNKTNIDNKGYITSSITDLENFYNKTEIDNKNYITSSVTNLDNFYNKTEIDELIPEIEQHIFMVDNIPEEIIPNSIYVLANTKQTYISDNNGILSSINYEIISDLSQHTTDTNTIPDCKAVVDYVNNKCNNYILTGTIFDYNTDISGTPDLSIYLLSSTFAEISGNFALSGDLLKKIEFNINEELPSSNLSSNILYITPSGEVGVVIDNELTNLSVKAITDLTQHIADDDAIPTCKAVVDYIGQFTSGDVQHIFYVNELPVTPIKNSIYALTNTKQLYISDSNSTIHDLYYEIVNNITSSSTNLVIPGAKAVYDFVTDVTANYITSSVTDLTNFYNKDEVSGLISGSIPTIISDLSQHTTDIDTIPACKAVVDYVSGVIEDLPVGDVQHIFYVGEIPQTKVNNSIYVLSGVNQTFITDNNNNIYNLSYEISEEITSTSTNDTIPGTKAVYDYVNSHSGGSSSKTYLEIQYGVDQQDCTWNNGLLIITNTLDTPLPFVQIYITENNSYTLTNIPYVIDKTSHNIIINCAGYENKLISVKIID